MDKVPMELRIADNLLETATYVLNNDDSDEKWDVYALLVDKARMYLGVGITLLETK